MGVHRELDIRPGLTLDEFRILRRIAVLDTLELHQRPRMVHLLGGMRLQTEGPEVRTGR